MSDAAKLAACPFCGLNNLNVANTGSCWVRCLVPDCYCEGPVCDTEADAIHAWNTRALSSEGQEKKSTSSDGGGKLAPANRRVGSETISPVAGDTKHQGSRTAGVAPGPSEALALNEGEREIDPSPRMWKIADLIAKMQSVLDQFGNTCVYIRRGGMGWGAVALNREADDEKHGVFDLQAQHDRDMGERLGQIERLKADRDQWRQKVWDAEAAASRSPPVCAAWQPIETAPEGVPVWGWLPPQNGLHECYGTVELVEQEDGVWFSSHDGDETFTPSSWMPANKPRRPSPAAPDTEGR